MGCASSVPLVAEGESELSATWRRCVVARRVPRAASVRCSLFRGRRLASKAFTRREESNSHQQLQQQQQHRQTAGKAGFAAAPSELARLSGGNSEASEKSSAIGDSPGIGTGISRDELSNLFGGDPNGDHANDKSPTKGKERRVGFGVEAVREQLRRIAVGGSQTEMNKANLYEVLSSEESDMEDEPPAVAPDAYEPLWKPPGVAEAICHALQEKQVFHGIDKDLLQLVVDRMYGISYKQGSTIVQQGMQGLDDTDCMFFLEKGEVDIVITGSVEQSTNDEFQRIEGNVAVIRKGSGWIFGDVALLFNTPRTASIVTATAVTVWALERKTFLQFVLRHAPGVRTLRFIRRLPLLKGLSDNALLNVAQHLQEKTYNDGEAMIRFGEQGDQLFLIRKGKVRVLRPVENNEDRTEVACLGRGQIVGERTMVTGRLRSADCIASGKVSVVAINKKDFWELDNPLLSWMLDYDAVTCALKSLPQLQKLTHVELEVIIERFDSRKLINEGGVILREGQLVDQLHVVKAGELEVSKHSGILTPTDKNFIREAGGFSFFGEEFLYSIKPSPVTITVKSSTAQFLTLCRSELDDFVGPLTDSLPERDIPSIVSVLVKIPFLSQLADEQIEAIAKTLEVRAFDKGDIVASPIKSSNAMLIVKSGQCLLKENEHVKLAHKKDQCAQELNIGDYYGEKTLIDSPTCSDSAIVLCHEQAEVMFLHRDTVEAAIGNSLREVTKDHSMGGVLGGLIPSMHLVSGIRFSDLEQHRIVGTGQFGLVRVVRHIPTDNAYALKVMHKAPITESKQVEHVVNERQILEEANHPFCVGLVNAFQDASSLYLLQEWVPGGELFHHLDLEGSFDEATAMFYAANVLLALEFLHSKGIVYRDLKPENLLLDLTGYIKVADFGFAKKIGKEQTFTICGTPDYQAPEVIMRRGTNKAADYWALGVLIFEMLNGDPPFKSASGDPWDTFRRTLSGRFYVPNFISADAADIIYKLLQVNPERRLGSGQGGISDIKNHRWFAGMDWDALMEKRLPAPVIPRVHNPLDTSNFDVFHDVDAPPHSPNGRTSECDWGDALWEWVDTF